MRESQGDDTAPRSVCASSPTCGTCHHCLCSLSWLYLGFVQKLSLTTNFVSYAHGTMHRKSMSINKCPARCNYTQFILSVNCSTCFGWSLHPKSGAQITVSTASGTSQRLLLPVAVVEDLRLSLTPPRLRPVA